MEESVLKQVDNGIGILTVNRPEVRNAMDAPTFRELMDAFNAFDCDERVRVIVVTGAGEKAFVSGADLNMLKKRNPAETFRAFNSKAFETIENITKPTIAAINGYAFGGGLELAMACDIRICSRTAKLGQTELNLGFLPGAGGTQRLTRLVGPSKAKELIFTGKPLTAEEALNIGLVNQVVEPSELMHCVMDIAGQITCKSPLILAFAKLVINKGNDCGMDTALALERLGQTAAFSTADHIEGICAFLEKRTPKFEGR